MADSKIYLGPLLEDATAAIVNNLSNSLGGTINLMSSALQGVTNAMSDRLAGLLGNVKTATDNMKTATDNMKTSMDSVKSSVTTINTTLGATNGKIDTTNSRMSTLNTTMGNAVRMALTPTGGKTGTSKNPAIGAQAAMSNPTADPVVIPDTVFTVGTSSGQITINIAFKTSINVTTDLYLHDITAGTLTKIASAQTYYGASYITPRDYVVPVVAGHSYQFYCRRATSTTNSQIQVNSEMKFKYGLTPENESSYFVV